MLLMPGRKAACLLFAAVCCAAASAARANQPPAPDESVIQNDQVIQALKDEVLEFSREAQAIEDEVLYPPHSRLSIYLGVKITGLILSEVSLAIDDQAAQKFTYSDKDAKALLSDRNLQRLLRTNIGPGPHRIRVSFVGKFYDDKPEETPLSDAYEAIFDKGLSETELEFLISRPTRFGRPALSMKQWRASK